MYSLKSIHLWSYEMVKHITSDVWCLGVLVCSRRELWSPSNQLR